MIVRQTSKTHPEFHSTAAAKLFAEHDSADEKLDGEMITSPWDLYSVETLRERHHLRTGEAIATDLFVFGKGEPDDPAGTKVGGIPYWPDNQPWPTLSDGSPRHFLAQFNFSDSTDLIGVDLPGRVLVLLTNSEEDWMWEQENPKEGDSLSFHWIFADITPAKNLNVPSAIGSAGPFYGAIHRTADYPNAASIADELDVSQHYNLPVLNGTKIGGLPHFIQGGSHSENHFLCQLSSIQAAPFVPYPWVNQPEPLSLDFNNQGIHGDENAAMFGDMGSIYLFIEDDGRVSRSFECY